jgi:hypothetical protein
MKKAPFSKKAAASAAIPEGGTIPSFGFGRSNFYHGCPALGSMSC